MTLTRNNQLLHLNVDIYCFHFISGVLKKTRYPWKDVLDYKEKTHQSIKCNLNGGISANKDFVRTLLIWQGIK